MVTLSEYEHEYYLWGIFTNIFEYLLHSDLLFHIINSFYTAVHYHWLMGLFHWEDSFVILLVYSHLCFKVFVQTVFVFYNRTILVSKVRHYILALTWYLPWARVQTGVCHLNLSLNINTYFLVKVGVSKFFKEINNILTKLQHFLSGLSCSPQS